MELVSITFRNAMSEIIEESSDTRVQTPQFHYAMLTCDHGRILYTYKKFRRLLDFGVLHLVFPKVLGFYSIHWVWG